MTPETKLKNAVLAMFRRVQARGGRIWWLKVHGSCYQHPGVPDMIVISGGRTVWIELKVDDNRLSAIQKRTIGMIEAAGGRVAVCRSVDEVAEALSIPFEFLRVNA